MSCPTSLKTVCVEILEGQRGPQGLQGIQGIQGPSGPVGASGLSIKGDTGEASTIAGATGATGAAGASIKGDSGERGEKGSTGQQGIQGIQGVQGSQGNVGATGSTGPSGAVGASGLSVTGATGATGLQGPSGVPSTVAGASGLNAALTFNYRVDLSGEQNLETEPLHQEIRFAGGVDPTTATHLLVNKNSLNLSALGSLFLSFQQGTLFLTSQSQPNTFIAYTFSQVQNGGGLFSTYVIFEIAMISQFNALADDDLISFGIALKGDTGATGADSTVSGPQGDTGIQGPSGAPSTVSGPQGATGATGPTSAVSGPQGATGATGADSTVSGPQGSTGATGPAGVSDKYYGTSTTTLSVGNGSRTLTTQPGLSYSYAQPITIAYSVNGEHMHGLVTSYDPATGVLIAQISAHTGNGTWSNWIINLEGVAGIAGATGATGAASTVSGPQGATGATGSAQSFAWDLTTSSGVALETLSINGFTTADIPALYHVSIDGINQHANAYTLSSGVLTFAETVDAAAQVEIKRPKLI